MRNTISNSSLTVSVDSLGAELASIADSHGTEYLWQGDPDIWSGRAPVLFPIVGALKNGSYEYEGKSYSMNQHGFARRSEFELVSSADDRLTYRLVPTEKTREAYPFEFGLLIAYTVNENCLEVAYAVTNNDSKPIPFSIGAHPGFSLKWGDDDAVEDYYLEFAEKETAESWLLDDDKLLSRNSELSLKDESILRLTKSMFESDALIYKGLNSDSVTLRSDKHPNTLTVDFPGFPDLGIWAKPAAPYVCIEPWFGHVDPATHNGNIMDKPGIITLDPGSVFTCAHRITVKS